MSSACENSLQGATGRLNGALQDPRSMASKAADESSAPRRSGRDPELAGGAAVPGMRSPAPAEAHADVLGCTAVALRRLAAGLAIARKIVQYVAEIEEAERERCAEFARREPATRCGYGCSRRRRSTPTSRRRCSPSGLQARWREARRRPSVREGGARRHARRRGGARRWSRGTKLADPAVRKTLVDGGAAAVAASTDPHDRAGARARSRAPRDCGVRSRTTSRRRDAGHGDEIAQARFAVYGSTLYPDATFTLRLIVRRGEGLPSRGGRPSPRTTTFYGLYDRAVARPRRSPCDLPARWRGAEHARPRHAAQLRRPPTTSSAATRAARW